MVGHITFAWGFVDVVVVDAFDEFRRSVPLAWATASAKPQEFGMAFEKGIEI